MRKWKKEWWAYIASSERAGPSQSKMRPRNKSFRLLGFDFRILFFFSPVRLLEYVKNEETLRCQALISKPVFWNRNCSELVLFLVGFFVPPGGMPLPSLYLPSRESAQRNEAPARKIVE